MMMSVKEIAEKLNLSKIMVYRFINDNEIKYSDKNGRTFLYDTKAFEEISKGLKDKTPNDKKKIDENTENIQQDKDQDMIIEILKSEIEIKNVQINELSQINKNLIITLQQQQTLLLNEQQKHNKLIEENIKKKRWWKWWE